MLQQILRDMYVEPEILAALDDQQKQTLFFKMREEQVRRWKIWNDSLLMETEEKDSIDSSLNLKKSNNKKYKKQVSFLKDADGEPWVWVMGEHKNDKTIEDILKDENIERARKIAEIEADQLRKQVEAQLYLELQEQQPNSHQDEEIYCCVDEISSNNNKTSQILSRNHISSSQSNNNELANTKFSNGTTPLHSNQLNLIDSRDVLHDFPFNRQKVTQRIAMWEKLVTEERASQIYKTICKKRQEVAKEAELAAKDQEYVWLEQERRAKRAEQKMREIARLARKENSTFEIESPTYSTAGRTQQPIVVNGKNNSAPPDRESILNWYRTKEKPRFAGLLLRNQSLNSPEISALSTKINGKNSVEDFQLWFHGLLKRSEAEKLLLDQPYGTFLVRLSEKIWGYAISYRAKEKCKHYLISADSVKYQFLGNNQVQHTTLNNLIDYHRNHPLTGGDKLLLSCPRNWNQSSLDPLRIN